MASTETRPSFRLPWSTGPAESSDAPYADEPLEPGAEASTDNDDPHDGDDTKPAEAIERSGSAADATPPDQPTPVVARRATKFMAELSHAMQAAAEHARGETMDRFQAEAKSVVEEIHAGATTEAADLRRKADDDVAAIRDWSKAEIARVREETEGRVAARKVALDGEMEAHAADVEARAERVTAVVAAFETEMSAFFDRLNAEEDPTRIATMAETMPDPPSLQAVAASIAAPAGAASVAPPATTIPEIGASDELAPETEIDFAAAEAEALSFDADALDDEETETETEPEPSADASEATADVPVESKSHFQGTGEQATTRVVVTGLISVASIANFKRSLARVAGIWTIGVSSGPNTEFVFTVNHDAGLALAREIASMPSFESKVTGEADGEIQVSAHDRDAAD